MISLIHILHLTVCRTNINQVIGRQIPPWQLYLILPMIGTSTLTMVQSQCTVIFAIFWYDWSWYFIEKSNTVRYWKQYHFGLNHILPVCSREVKQMVFFQKQTYFVWCNSGINFRAFTLYIQLVRQRLSKKKKSVKEYATMLKGSLGSTH